MVLKKDDIDTMGATLDAKHLTKEPASERTCWLTVGLMLMLICCVSRIKIHIQECCSRGLGYGVHGAEEST